MYVVGITGGIGSGKSTIAGYFAALDVPVTDTDLIAHQLTAPGMPAVTQIAQRLGGEYVIHGALDRDRLRHKIFADSAARKVLENILHPLIRTAAMAALDQAHGAPYQILVVPLLFESGAYQDIITRSLVVDCREETQIRRAMTRSNLSAGDVHAIMAAQLPREERLARADDVILNDDNLQELAEKVREQHEKYINTCLVRQSTT